MRFLIIAISLTLLASQVASETIFVEAENFTSSSDGWKIASNPQTRPASRVKSLNGAAGGAAATASKSLAIKEAGNFRIWVRHNFHTRYRGPFRLTVSNGDSELAGKDFDLTSKADTASWSYVWDYFDVDLPRGNATLKLSKFENKNCLSYVRHVDCVLLTTDKSLIPDHLPYGPQTWLRVKVGDVYEKPIQIHVFADHHRAPWYGHFYVCKSGAQSGLYPKKDQLLSNGEQTPWCNITPMLYQDNGAILNFTARYTYHQQADRLKARFEFASAPNEESIVRIMDVDSTPNGLVVVAPPDLTTAENRSRLMRDREFAEATGKRADSFPWPSIGKKPQQFPFFVSAQVGGYGTKVDQSIMDREWKTLDYFGFSNRKKHYIAGGIWLIKEGSFCRPDLELMRKNIVPRVEAFQQAGNKLDDVVYCFLTDEPTGQSSTFMAGDEAYREAFRTWLRKLGKTPADLLVDDWDTVNPIAETNRDQYPALHYYTQRFRTRALGDFMAVQRGVIEEAYGRSFPTLVNFSDGATYHANFYSQGVDYFELLNDDNQNAIWSEDWANGSSSDQCGSFNVDLMRAAARERGQTMGHYLVAHAGRKPWDIKLKSASEVARGVKILKNFSYGVSWGSHEGGPFWNSHTWYARPYTWRANAEVVREIGGAEDLLLPAMPRPAEVAILYSSSTDAWEFKRNYAHGFDRMHTWMALTHAQVPVDFLSEQHVEDDWLDAYKVCYLSGPNLSRAAADRLKTWVERGGTLFLTAGAASRDEYNRPLRTLESIIPVDREEMVTVQPFLSSGTYLHALKSQDTVNVDGADMEVLSVQQKLAAKDGTAVLGRFQDGSPALVSGKIGLGQVFYAGFLPALDYIKKAEVARRGLEQIANETGPISSHPAPPVILTSNDLMAVQPKNRLERSRNPWQYPGQVRSVILTPVRAAEVTPPLTCSIPLIDAVPMHCDQGIVIPLANYTLAPIEKVAFTLQTDEPVARVETIYQGQIGFEKTDVGIAFSLPIDCTDYVKVYYK